MSKINPVNPVTFSSDTAYVFRRGMMLKNSEIRKLFSHPILVGHPDFEEYVEEGHHYTIRGTDKVRNGVDVHNIPRVTVPKYRADWFTWISDSSFVDLYKNENTRNNKISPSVVNKLSDFDFRLAIFSGYLKTDTRGYYFTKNPLALYEFDKLSDDI